MAYCLTGSSPGRRFTGAAARIDAEPVHHQAHDRPYLNQSKFDSQSQFMLGSQFRTGHESLARTNDGQNPSRYWRSPRHPMLCRSYVPNRSTTARGSISSLCPLLRKCSSTLPFANPRGPTVMRQGRPIRSIVANFAPARSSRSS